jgi:Zn-dependent peptidase ImmA (M78 family)/DNA-binding XRE family transcriptional regulator
MLGERLKLARAKAGLSLRDLESKLGGLVSAQAIGKYERGEMLPSSRVLIALSDALGVSERYLVGQGDIKLDGIEFRKKKITQKREEAQVEAATLDLIERYLEVEEILQVPSREWNKPREGPHPVSNATDAELAAVKLREHWNLGVDPIAVSGLAEFLEEQGIKIVGVPLPENVSGLTCWVRRRDHEAVPAIVINHLHNGERQRFTLSHELGHLFMEPQSALENEEAAADRFAGAFLMPAETMRAEIGSHRKGMSLGELFALKSLFGTSVQAIAYRLRDLGSISPTLLKDLYKSFARAGWLKPPYVEPLPLPKEEPQRFRRLCFRALTEGAISESKTAELLGISVRALNHEMEEAPQDA